MACIALIGIKRSVLTPRLQKKKLRTIRYSFIELSSIEKRYNTLTWWNHLVSIKFLDWCCTYIIYFEMASLILLLASLLTDFLFDLGPNNPPQLTTACLINLHMLSNQIMKIVWWDLNYLTYNGPKLGLIQTLAPAAWFIPFRLPFKFYDMLSGSQHIKEI